MPVYLARVVTLTRLAAILITSESTVFAVAWTLDLRTYSDCKISEKETLDLYSNLVLSFLYFVYRLFFAQVDAVHWHLSSATCLLVLPNIVCGAGSMKRYAVLPSFRLSIRLSNPAAVQVCCCSPGGQKIAIDCGMTGRRSAAAARGGRMRAVARCQRTLNAKHRLVL